MLLGIKGLICYSVWFTNVFSEHSEVDLSVPTPHADDAMDPDDDPDEEDEFDED